MAIKVLIAHGNTQRLKLAVSDLHAAGFEVVATPDGGDAFARFFEEMPEIVICSTTLPSLNGAGITRMVRSQSPETAVVLLVESADEPAEAGVVKLVEPFTLGKLRDALPEIAFDAPFEIDVDVEPSDLTAASPQQVFFHAVLKRFQRDNRALQALDDTGIGRMAALADNRNFGDNERIIRQGDDGDGFYLLVEGQVRVTLQEKDDKEVARIPAGGFFGEMAMLNSQRRSASVWSINQTTTLYFARDAFLPFLNDYPTMREVLSGVALKRTEENLWRVLFDDDEVQRSLAQLDQSSPAVDAAVDAQLADQQAAAGRVAEVPAPDARPVPTSIASEAARVAPAVAVAARPPWQYATAGFVGGVAASLFVQLLMPNAPAPAAPQPVAQVAPVAQPDPVEPTAVGGPAPTAERGVETTAAASAPSAPGPAPVETPPTEAKPAEAKPSEAKPAETKPTEAKPAEPAAAAKPNDTERAALGDAYKAGQFKQVLSLARKLPAPLDPDAAFMVADAERNTGAATALQSYLDFVAAQPGHHRADDAQFWAAELYTQRGMAAEAKALYEKVAANEKSNFRNSAVKRLAK